MVKLITLITKFVLIALTSILFSSCNNSANLQSIEGSGHITTEKRIVQGEFKKIAVSNAIDLVVEQSELTEIIVEADDNLQKDITTKVENGVLVIQCEYNSFNNVKSKKVTVRMPIIEDLKASSAASVNSGNTLKGETINLDASSAALINITIESNTISCESSSGSSIDINGKALKLVTSASSGSTINAKDLLVNDVRAEASSGAEISVNAIVGLQAEASSGGTINYSNSPKSINKKTSSGGSIHQE